MDVDSISQNFTKEKEVAMWMYVCANIHNPVTGLVEVGRIDPFSELSWRQYMQENDTRQEPHAICEHFARMISRIEDTDMDFEMKVKLCFALRISISKSYFQELKENADVELRENGSIRMFRKEGGLQLEDVVSEQEFKEEEDEAIVKFVLNRLDETYNLKKNFLPKTIEFWEKFKEETGSERDATSLLNRFRHTILPNFHSRKVETHLKIKMLRALEVPLTDDALRELRKDAVILMHDDNTIDAYGMFPPILARVKSTSKRSFSIIEDNDMWMFVLMKIRHPVTGVAQIMKERFDSLKLWEEFTDLLKKSRLAEAYRKRFSLILAPNIVETNFTKQTKLELFYGLEQPVDKDFLMELKKDAEVEVDEYDILTRYHQKRPNGISLGKKTTKRNLGMDLAEQRRPVYPGFLKNPRKKAKLLEPVEDDEKDEENKLVVYEPEEDSDEYESSPRKLRAATPVDINGNKLTLEQQIAMKEEERKMREKKREEENEKLIREWEERRKNVPGPSEQVTSSSGGDLQASEDDEDDDDVEDEEEEEI